MAATQSITKSKTVVKHSSATQPQLQFWNSDALLRLFVAGVGSGKTRAGCVECLRQPGGSVGVVVSPTYRMLQDSTLKTFLELTRNAGVLANFNKSDLTARLVNETTILFRSGDEADKLRGTNLSWAFLDEGGLCDEEVFLILLGRLRLAPGKLWICTTPRGKDHWLYRTFVQNATANHEVIRSSTRDNPFLPESYIQTLETQYTEVFRRQEVEGEWVDLEGSLFRRNWFQTVEHTPENLRWHRYWDLAASTKTQADYSASAAVALHRESGDVYVRNVIRLKEEWPTVRRVIIETAKAERGTVVGVESAVHGLAGFQELQREPELVGTTLRSIRVDKDKVSRALPVASRAEAGKVKLIRGEWISDFLDECSAFPAGAHDDQVDAVSGAFQMITSRAEWRMY